MVRTIRSTRTLRLRDACELGADMCVCVCVMYVCLCVWFEYRWWCENWPNGRWYSFLRVLAPLYVRIVTGIPVKDPTGSYPTQKYWKKFGW